MLAAIATTSQAAKILQPLSESIEATLYLPKSVNWTEKTQIYHESTKKHLIWKATAIFCDDIRRDRDFCLNIKYLD